MDLWLVGKWTGPMVPLDADATGLCKAWEFQGIFDDEWKAIDACRDHRYWVAPVQLNESLPDESTPFPDSWFPILAPEWDKVTREDLRKYLGRPEARTLHRAIWERLGRPE